MKSKVSSKICPRKHLKQSLHKGAKTQGFLQTQLLQQQALITLQEMADFNSLHGS